MSPFTFLVNLSTMLHSLSIFEKWHDELGFQTFFDSFHCMKAHQARRWSNERRLTLYLFNTYTWKVKVLYDTTFVLLKYFMVQKIMLVTRIVWSTSSPICFRTKCQHKLETSFPKSRTCLNETLMFFEISSKIMKYHHMPDLKVFRLNTSS